MINSASDKDNPPGPYKTGPKFIKIAFKYFYVKAHPDIVREQWEGGGEKVGSKITSSELIVYILILKIKKLVGGKGGDGSVFISNLYIANTFGISENRASLVVSGLVSKGLIETEYTRKGYNVRRHIKIMPVVFEGMPEALGLGKKYIMVSRELMKSRGVRMSDKLFRAFIEGLIANGQKFVDDTRTVERLFNVSMRTAQRRCVWFRKEFGVYKNDKKLKQERQNVNRRTTKSMSRNDKKLKIRAILIDSLRTSLRASTNKAGAWVVGSASSMSEGKGDGVGELELAVNEALEDGVVNGVGLAVEVLMDGDEEKEDRLHGCWDILRALVPGGDKWSFSGRDRVLMGRVASVVVEARGDVELAELEGMMCMSVAMVRVGEREGSFKYLVGGVLKRWG